MVYAYTLVGLLVSISLVELLYDSLVSPLLNNQDVDETYGFISGGLTVAIIFLLLNQLGPWSKDFVENNPGVLRIKVGLVLVIFLLFAVVLGAGFELASYLKEIQLTFVNEESIILTAGVCLFSLHGYAFLTMFSYFLLKAILTSGSTSKHIIAVILSNSDWKKRWYDLTVLFMNGFSFIVIFVYILIALILLLVNKVKQVDSKCLKILTYKLFLPSFVVVLGMVEAAKLCVAIGAVCDGVAEYPAIVWPITDLFFTKFLFFPFAFFGIGDNNAGVEVDDTGNAGGEVEVEVDDADTDEAEVEDNDNNAGVRRRTGGGVESVPSQVQAVYVEVVDDDDNYVSQDDTNPLLNQ